MRTCSPIYPQPGLCGRAGPLGQPELFVRGQSGLCNMGQKQR